MTIRRMITVILVHKYKFLISLGGLITILVIYVSYDVELSARNI